MLEKWLFSPLCYKLLQNIFCKKMSLKNTTKFLISIIPSNTEIRFLRTLCFVLNLLSKSSKVHLWLCCIITKIRTKFMLPFKMNEILQLQFDLVFFKPEYFPWNHSNWKLRENTALGTVSIWRNFHRIFLESRLKLSLSVRLKCESVVNWWTLFFTSLVSS